VETIFDGNMKYFAILLTAFIFFGCAPKNKQPASSADGQRTSSHDTVSANQQSVAVNYKENVSHIISVKTNGKNLAPDFSWHDSTGKRITFAEFSKGKPVLVNFWATWCGPCIAETPDLVKINEEFKSKGALVIGISADRDDDALNLVSEFTKEKNVKYPVVIDNGDLQEAFGGLRGYPTSFYIDKKGKVVKKLLGLQTKEKFASEFKALL